MGQFRDRLKLRGARGIVGLQRTFKIMDDDQSHTLSLPEFTKACRDFKIGIQDEYLQTLFDSFDSNRDGTLSVQEFLYAIRGDLNPHRHQTVTRAYQSLKAPVTMDTLR